MKIAGGGIAIAKCEASQLTIILDQPEIDGYISAFIVAGDISNILVGALGFSLGSGYSTELIQVIEGDGTPHVFGVRPTGGEPSTNLAIEPYLTCFNQTYLLSGKDIHFRLAVRDYLQAITEVIDCATYCYRAIEGIKSAFAEKNDSSGWDEMHAALGSDRDQIIKNIKDFADPVRHGNWVNAKITTNSDRWNMLLITRDVLASYLRYRQPHLEIALDPETGSAP